MKSSIDPNVRKSERSPVSSLTDSSLVASPSAPSARSAGAPFSSVLVELEVAADLQLSIWAGTSLLLITLLFGLLLLAVLLAVSLAVLLAVLLSLLCRPNESPTEAAFAANWVPLISLADDPISVPPPTGRTGSPCCAFRCSAAGDSMPIDSPCSLSIWLSFTLLFISWSSNFISISLMAWLIFRLRNWPKLRCSSSSRGESDGALCSSSDGCLSAGWSLDSLVGCPIEDCGRLASLDGSVGRSSAVADFACRTVANGRNRFNLHDERLIRSRTMNKNKRQLFAFILRRVELLSDVSIVLMFGD